MKWTLINKPIAELKEYERNPRRLTKKGLEDLEKSINKFGLAEPLVVNTDGTIIGGHSRFKVLEKNGAKEVPCYMPERELNPKEVEEINVRLNKNVAGIFDTDKLANEFDITDLKDWGFDDFDLGLGEGEETEGKDRLSECPNCECKYNKKKGIIKLKDAE